MKRTIILVLLVTVVALSSAMPKNCRGRNCRRIRPSRPVRPVVPVVLNKLPVVVARRPASAPTRIPVVTEAPVTEVPVTESASVPEKEMVTDTDGQEVREVGVNGWLDEPTPSPVDPALARTDNNSKADKPGSCDTPKGFGIKCMMRLDQCTTDVHCPGSTKCCMVGECGYLCVKPKPTSTEPKEVTKEIINKKNKGDKTNSKETTGDLSAEASEIVEATELPEGALKAEDIIEMPEEMKTKNNVTEEVMEVEQEEEEEMKKTKKNGDESPKEVEKEEETLPKEVEKVIEKVEEILEEEIKKVEEDEEVTTTQANEEETLSEK